MRDIEDQQARGLLHKDLLFKESMEKCIGDVKLPEGPFEADSNGENESDSSWFDNRTEGFSVVNARLLVKTFGNQACLIPSN